jgi:hypothetical protein
VGVLTKEVAQRLLQEQQKLGSVAKDLRYWSRKNTTTGPVDPGIPTESITSFKDNFKARQRVLGSANIIPGATIFNAIGAARDTIVGRKAMNMSPTITAAQKLQTVGAQDNQAVTCPPGYINVGGQCVKQASKGGAMKYYKGLL